MILPKPFSKVLLIAGTPIVIPEDVPREAMSQWAEFLHLEMKRLESIARDIQSGHADAGLLIDRSNDPSYHPQQTSVDNTRAA